MPTMEELHNLDNTTSRNQRGIDKKIPIALIGVVIFQTVAITWGAATLSSDVKNYGERIKASETRFEILVEKIDAKYETRANHTLDKTNNYREIIDIKKDIDMIEQRIRFIEKNMK